MRERVSYTDAHRNTFDDKQQNKEEDTLNRRERNTETTTWAYRCRRKQPLRKRRSIVQMQRARQRRRIPIHSWPVRRFHPASQWNSGTIKHSGFRRIQKPTTRFFCLGAELNRPSDRPRDSSITHLIHERVF